MKSLPVLDATGKNLCMGQYGDDTAGACRYLGYDDGTYYCMKLVAGAREVIDEEVDRWIASGGRGWFSVGDNCPGVKNSQDPTVY